VKTPKERRRLGPPAPAQPCPRKFPAVRRTPPVLRDGTFSLPPEPLEVQRQGRAQGCLDVRRLEGSALASHEGQGVRVRFTGKLGQAQAAMQIDFGFGDTVSPKPREIDYPTFLDMPAPKLRGHDQTWAAQQPHEGLL